MIYQDNNLDHLEAIKWHHEHDKDASKTFCSLETIKHFDLKVKPAGLFDDKTTAYIGASTDKIKSPHKIWDKTIKHNFKYLDFLTLNTNGTKSIDKKCKYYTQINSKMFLAKSDQCYFVVWTTKDFRGDS